MRLIDADALLNLPFEKMIHTDYGDTCVPIEEIEMAPTIEPFEPDYVGKERFKARQRGYEEGYRNGIAIGETLNPKIKQGEWIIHPHSMIMRCSLCGHEENAKDVGTINPDKHFCSFCGAEMKSGQEAKNETDN